MADSSSENDLAMLFTTSGTTKLPKLVMHTQRSLASHADCVARAFRFDQPGAGLLAPLPFCGTFGLVPVMTALAAGIPIAVMGTFDAKPAVDLIRKHQLTHLFGSDEVYRRILDAMPEDLRLDSLRVCGFAAFQAGAEDLVRLADARGIPLAGVYDSSEVQTLLSIQTRQRDAIRLSGFLVNPSEIEDVLRGCPSVVEAQVIGADVGGVQSCVAFVIAELDSDVDADGVLAWLRNTVAPFKVPVRIWFLDAFPVTKSANGVKIQRAKLREMAARRDRSVNT